MLNNYKVIIFDWDGTLMDSISHIVQSVQRAAVYLDVMPPDDEQVKNIIGLSLPDAFSVLFGSESEALYQQFRASYKDIYHHKDSEDLPLFQHAYELVATLSGLDKKLAVATGKGRPGLDKAMQRAQLAEFFHYSRTSDEAQSKPSPDMLQQIMKHFDALPDECVMIGDSVHDLKMAQNAGMASIGVSFGAHSKAKLHQHSPLSVIDCYTELLHPLA